MSRDTNSAVTERTLILQTETATTQLQVISSFKKSKVRIDFSQQTLDEHSKIETKPSSNRKISYQENCPEGIALHPLVSLAVESVLNLNHEYRHTLTEK
jgi:hypothetical protein